MLFKKKRAFSSFWFFVLIIAVVWLLTELGYINIGVPWLPLIVVVVALGAFINHLLGR